LKNEDLWMSLCSDIYKIEKILQAFNIQPKKFNR